MRAPRITAEQAIRALLKLGFLLVRSTGSHRVFRHPDSRLCVVPFHAGRILSQRVFHSIVKDTQLDLEEFRRLL